MDNINYISDNKFEVHYYFVDDTHFMDAVVRNKCEYELLGIIRELSRLAGVEIIIETEPFGEGGLRQWLKLLLKQENKKAPVTLAFIIMLLTSIVSPIEKISEKIIENIFEDQELKGLEKEKIKLEIEKLKKEIDVSEDTSSGLIIRKRKSNFYQALDNYSKIEKVSFSIVNNDNIKTSKELIVSKNNFPDFILGTNGLEPIEVESAIIEIISPVLKKGKYKWLGIYDGIPVYFVMKSSEFKALVQEGVVEFKNGSSINCHLQIKREIDNEGKQKLTGYTVVRVNNYFQNQKPVETNEGRQHRQRKEVDKNQLALFSNDEK